jgi:MFS family permease
MNLTEQIRLEKKNIAILGMCEALVMSINSILLTINPLIGYMLSAEKSQATLPIALFQLAGMFSIFPASFLMKRLGRRSGFMIGVLIGIIGSGVGIYGIYLKSFDIFTAATFLMGISNGFAGFYIFAAADAVRKPNRSKAISFVMAGGVLAALIGPLLVIWMQGLVESQVYIGPFISIFIFQILSLVLLCFLSIPKLNEEVTSTQGRPFIKIIKQSSFILSILSGVCSNGVMVFVMTATPLAMSTHHHNIDDTALSMQLHLLGMFVPSFFTGYLIARFNSLRVMICGAAVIVASIVINTAEFSLFNISLAMFLLGLGWNFINISSTTLLTEACTPEDQTMIQALYEFIILSSMAFFVYLSGWTINKYGWLFLNFSSISVLIVLFVGITIILQRKRYINA